MDIDVTEEAIEVLSRSLQMAGIDPGSGGVRLRVARGLGGGGEVQVELAEGPVEGDEVVEAGGLRLFVDPSLPQLVPDPIVTVAPMHDHIVVRPGTERGPA